MKIEFDKGDGRLLDIMALGSLRAILFSAKALYEGQEAYDEWINFLHEIERNGFNKPVKSFYHKFQFGKKNEAKKK